MASSSSNNSALIKQLDTNSRDLIAKIIAKFKSQGNFDELRRECVEELDKMESFRQLNQRVESYVATFLSKQEWSDSLSKNQIRDNLRKHVCASDALKSGVQRLVTQVLDRKSKSFQNRIEGVTQNYIYMEKEKERQSRFQSRYMYDSDRSAKSFDKRDEPEKAAVTVQTSTISDVNDIISQIDHANIDSSVTTHHTSAPQKNDTCSSKQNVPSIHSKNEQNKFERKGDIAPSVLSKSNIGPKRLNQNKRVMPEVGGSPHDDIVTEKAVEVNANSRAKTSTDTCKARHSPENSGEKNESCTNLEGPDKKVEGAAHSVKTDLKPPINSPASASKSSPEIGEKNINKEVAIVQHEDEQVVNNLEGNMETTVLTETRDVHVEISHSEKPIIHVEELQEKQLCKVLISSEKEEKKMPNLEKSEIKPLDSDAADEKVKIEESTCMSNSESDGSDDVSDVSSVHTSDLSSFDGEVSSVSEGSDEDAEEFFSKQDSKGNSELGEGSKRKSKSSSVERKSESTEESERKSGSRKSSKGIGTKVRPTDKTKSTGLSGTTVKRKRGRPRKEHTLTSGMQVSQQVKKPRPKKHADDTNISMHERHSSKRPIKKKRCYSPSSEGTREVCLPSKRTRFSSKD